MAGLIASLKRRNRSSGGYGQNLPGTGGVTDGPGPSGRSGFPGSTSATRTFKGSSPRDVGLPADSVVGFDQGFSGEQTRQVGRAYAEGWGNPRDTPEVTTPQPRTIASLRTSPQEWYGGQPIRSDAVAPAQHAIGGNPLMPAQAAGGHSTYDTETPRTSRQPDISGGVPGSQNVRNQIAQRFKNPPGQLHTYTSAPRPDQNPVHGNEAGATWAYATPVTVSNRRVWGSGGVQTWAVERQMPYGSGERGDGARGADLNGTRYYAEGPPVAVNAGLGAYGVGRLRGPRHRPVYFNEPAPWTSQFYDTTSSVGTPDAPGPGGQAPNVIYTSPDAGRGGITRTPRSG